MMSKFGFANRLAWWPVLRHNSSSGLVERGDRGHENPSRLDSNPTDIKVFQIEVCNITVTGSLEDV